MDDGRDATEVCRTSAGIDPDRAYEMYRRRLNSTPSGAPDHPAAVEILKLYCTAEQADFLSRMPTRFCSLPQLARLYRSDIGTVSEMVETLIDRFLVGDLDCGDGVHLYIPLEIIPGFWDMTFMRVDNHMPMDELAGLFDEYWNTFYPEVLGYGRSVQDFRTMVREDALGDEYTEILDYERTSHLIKTAGKICVGFCGCCSMLLKTGKKICDRPTRTCMSLNSGAEAVMRAGQGDEISVEEAMNILNECHANGMVQSADNVKAEPWYICNCCSCCCNLFRAIRDYDIKTTVVSSNFIGEIHADKCDNCGVCADACPVRCISQVRSSARIDQRMCVGCGVCKTVCPSGAVALSRRPRRVYTPDEYNEKFISMSLQRHKLAEQLFYDPNKFSHRMLCGLINTMLKIPPIKQILATDAVGSRFSKAIAAWVMRDFDRTVLNERRRIEALRQEP